MHFIRELEPYFIHNFPTNRIFAVSINFQVNFSTFSTTFVVNCSKSCFCTRLARSCCEVVLKSACALY